MKKDGLIEHYKRQILRLPYKMMISDKMLNDMAKAMVNQYGTSLVNKNLNSRQRRRNYEKEGTK